MTKIPASSRAKPGRRPPSAEFRAKASKAISDWNKRRITLPKCGAKTKTTGEPCKRLAMANGRCFLHGGRTPRGDKWHTTLWPNGSSPMAETKLNRKLKSQQQRVRKRGARIEAMSSEQRAQHERWHASHKPGGAAKRAQIRRQRDARVGIEELMSRPETPSIETARIQNEIDRLEALRGRKDEPTEHDIFS